MKVTAGLTGLKGSMRKSTSQLRIVVNNAPLSTQLTDTSGSPRESYGWSHMAAVRREWRQQFSRPYVEVTSLMLTEMRSIEARVREALYP
jgi:hypothetical protein